MTLPDMKARAQLDVSDFRKGAKDLLTDLKSIHDLGKKMGTIRVGIELGQGARDAQKAAQRIGDALREAASPMQGRIAGMFGEFAVGANSARQSAAVFEAQAAAVRARIDELARAVAISRAEFQSGFGEATPQEIAQLTQQMNRLSRELEEVGEQAKENFGEYSREAQKVANANRLAQTTAAAARGEITRLGLASQVKLGTSAALAQYGGQANFAANGLFQLALSSDKARIAQGLFNKTIEKTGQDSSKAAQAVKGLQDTLGVTEDAAREGLRGLLRQGYDIEQATRALTGAGASALAAGRSAQEGMDAYVDAVTSMSSARLNEIGIAENLSTFYQREAKARGTTTDGLTKQQKVQAELNLIMAATGDEVGDLTALLGGASGQMNNVSREFNEAGKELGQAFIPLVTNGMRQLTAFLDWFNDFPPAAKNFTAVLLASAVAVGVLATPVSSFINVMKSGVEWIGKYRAAGKVAAEVGDALNTSAKAGAFTRMLDWVKAAPGYWAAYRNGVLAATGANNLFTASAVKMMGTNLLTWLKTATVGVTAFAGIVGVAAAALGAYWVSSVRGITKTYEEADKANEESHNRLMARVKQLTDSGTELGRAQARYLLTTSRLSDAEAGTATGRINWITGEREIVKDEEAIKRLRQQREKDLAVMNEIAARTRKDGPVAVKLTEDQTKAVQELNKALEGRKFDLKLTGMTEMGRDLAKLGQEFDKLRQDFKKPFTVGGKLMDVNQTPALREGLARLDAQLLVEQQATRKRYADEAVEAARSAAKATQKAEIEAMQEGQAKKKAQRDQEIRELTEAYEKEAAKWKDFPVQQAEIEAEGQRQVKALKEQFRQEDLATAKDHAQRVQDAEASAEQAALAGLKDSLTKRELARKLDLEALKRNIRDRVAALEGDPEAQAKVQASGQKEIAGKVAEQNLARAQEIKDAENTILDARKAARDAQIALIKDETEKRQAEQNKQLEDLQESQRRQLDSFIGTADQRKRLEVEYQKQLRTLHQKHAQEDADDAKAAAQRIADAWAEVQEKQFAAQQAGRSRQLAEFNAQQARLQLKLKDQPVAQAQGERDAIPRRFQLEQELAEKQFAQEQLRLNRTAEAALRKENLTAEQKRIINENLIADLKKLDEDYLAGKTDRAVKKEQELAQNAEALRAAYLAESNKPIQQSENRQAMLNLDLQLARTDEEVLRLNREISKERSTQIQALQGQLIGLGGVVLTAEQREQVEQRIKQLQTEQVQGLRAQEEAQRNIRLSALDRLDAEAQYAEKVAQTAEQLAQARQMQLATAQTRLRELDSQIAAEGKEAERNRLLGQRFGLLGQIADLTEKINSAPLEEEKRKLDLYRAQAETRLVAAGLADDEVAKSRLALQIAAQELLIANQRVATAQGQLAVEAALSEQAQARLAFAQAYAALLGQEMAMPGGGTAAQGKSEAERNRERQESLKRQRDLESDLLDVAEARARALQVIRGEGENAVQNAELELQFTRERLALVTRQLDEGGMDAANRVPLLRERLTLLQQEVEQERRVTEARRAAADLADELVQAESALTAALAGGQLAAEGEATRRLAQARQALTRAEEAYVRARSEGDLGKIKDATEKLTSAIQAQRSAVAGLAEVYRQQIAGMDSVREASERLKQAAYGEDGPVFNALRERQRLDAISQRRNAAQVALAEALKGGDTSLIQKATEELTRQQERVNRQIEYLNKNGQKVTDAGLKRTRDLADQVELLGIEYDREAVNLAERAQIVDQESQNAMTLSAAATSFADATESLKRLNLAKQVEEIATELAGALKQAKLDADREAALASRLTGGGGSTGTAPQAVRFDPASINQLAQRFAGKLAPNLNAPQLEQAVAQGTRAGLASIMPTSTPGSPVTSLTQRPVSHTYTLNVGGVTINATSDKASDIKRAVNAALDDRIAAAKRDRNWGKGC